MRDSCMTRPVNDEAWASVSLRWAAVLMLIATVFDGAQGADMPDGQKLFKERCARCHRVQKVAHALRNRLPADREDFLERFLAGHHAPDPVERKALVAYVSEHAGN